MKKYGHISFWQSQKQSQLVVWQSFPYENNCESYKKLALRLWLVLFTLSYFFLYIDSPLLQQNN